MVISRRGLLSQTGFLAAGFGAAWLLREKVLWPAPKPRFEGAGSSGWLPFVARSVLPTLEVSVNGTPAAALLDSGAQYSVLDRAFADRIAAADTPGPPMAAYGVGGAVQVGRSAAVDVSFGDVRLQALRTAVLQLGPLSSAAELSIPVILGRDVMNALVAEIDFPGRRLRLDSPALHMPPAEATPLPSNRRGGALFSTVVVEGSSLEVLVDTGASSALSLSTQAAQAAGLLDGRRVKRVESLVLGGVAQGQTVTARQAALAGRSFEDFPVQIFDHARLPGAPNGLLGAEAFSDARAVFDLAQGRLAVVRT
jgi:predicted aspartyl protease